MFDMFAMCTRRRLKVPTPKIDWRGRKVYRIAVETKELYAIVNELVHGKCKPQVKIAHYAPTIELIEQRRTEVWYFRCFCSNKTQSENIFDEILLLIEPHRQYQEEFDL